MRLGVDQVSYRWITPDGKEQAGSRLDLVAQLSSGLPPKTLVWRSGWGEWLPANRVEELAQALPPGAAELPMEPSRSADPSSVPPRPQAVVGPGADPSETGSFAPVPPGARPAGKFVRPQILPPRIVLPSERNVPAAEPQAPPPSSFGVLSSKRPNVAPPSAPAPPPRSPSPFGFERATSRYEGGRPPMPTLTEEAPPATATLRPPAAVPPPPRGAAPTGPLLNPSLVERFSKATRAEDTPLPVKPSAPGTAEPVELSAEDVEMTSAPQSRPASTPSAGPPAHAVTSFAPLSSSPPRSAPLESGAPQYPGALLDTTLNSERAVRPALVGSPSAPALPPERTHAADPVRRLKLAVYSLGAGCALLALTAAVLWATRERAASTLEAPSASAAALPSAPATGCHVLAHPARIAADVDRSVPPLLTPGNVNGRAALGFAESSKKAVGMMLSATTLDAERVFERATERPLKSVVPLLSSGAPTFAVDLDSGPLKNARTVDATLPFTLGLGDGGIARVISSTPELVWPLAAASITEPRVASTPEGHVVTIREGGLEGHVSFGWLGPDGSKRSELVRIPGPRFVGTPFVAASPNGWVIAFAGRASNQDSWRVELAIGAPNRTDHRRVTFAARPGGLGGGQIAPSVAAVDGGQWMLQWTEGKTGMYQVRTQLLNSKLEPIGETLIVSPKGASSGQGSLFVSGKHAVSLYVQTIGGHDELWATTLECR